MKKWRLRTTFLSAMLAAGCVASTPPDPTAILPNDNQQSAGKLENGVLTFALEARQGRWEPEGPGGRVLDSLAAFAEVGKSMSTPGPLIRVPVGTTVKGTVKNTLARPLTVFGLGQTHGYSDSVVVAPGATVDVQFTADKAGTYYYIARRGFDPFLGRPPEDAQLHGAIVVDEPNARPDRIMAISWFFTLSPKSPSGLGHGTMAINGLSWPHTERLAYAQGDSIHWRVLNFTEVDHPMHLHGFYFRVDAHGTGAADTVYSPAQQRMAVTEVLPPFQTIGLAWQADRPGNWVYHCHYAAHLSNLVALDTEDGVLEESKLGHHEPKNGTHQMFGLVMGITVAPSKSEKAAGVPPADRIIRIVQREKPNVYGSQPGMSFVVDGTPESAGPDAMPVPGPALVLERGKRVQVTIVNQSSDHAAIHWHGIELESYPDGVPGWSGSGSNILPAIAPHDSLTVTWTPPRAGSFMYHSHFSENKQMGSGLYGPIIVLEPGEKFDPETDKVLFLGTAGTVTNVLVGPFPHYLVNGTERPAPMQLEAGTRYRFRLFNLAGDLPTMVSLTQNGKPAMWRAVAKDGYPLPPSQAVMQPAVLVFDPGEIYDYEFTSTNAGQFSLEYAIPPFLIPPPPPPNAPPPPLPPPQLPPPVKVAVQVR
jgi:manganese oxidase